MNDLEPRPDDLTEIEHRLAAERPVPRAAFRGELRRSLLRNRYVHRPRRLGLLVAVYGGSGALLLVVAAVGVAGAGPLAP
jgi:hypothetical protein